MQPIPYYTEHDDPFAGDKDYVPFGYAMVSDLYQDAALRDYRIMAAKSYARAATKPTKEGTPNGRRRT